jgi:hypothetical protein
MIMFIFGQIRKPPLYPFELWGHKCRREVKPEVTRRQYPELTAAPGTCGNGSRGKLDTVRKNRGARRVKHSPWQDLPVGRVE